MLRAWQLPSYRLFFLSLLALLTAAWAPGPAMGVILHPGGESGFSKPDDAVLTRQGVVIGPNHILTARHIGVKVGSSITVNGQSYKVAKVTTFGTADLKLLRMTKRDGSKANFTKYAPLYTGGSEIGKTIVMGGYGKGRGSNMTYGGRTYGYYWGSSGKRWGQNRVDGAGSLKAGSYTSQTLAIDFDPHGATTSVKGEAANGGSDSGSAWFIYDGGKWKTVGIAIAVEHGGQSWFRGKTGATDPDFNWAVRVSKYLSQIGSALGSEKKYSIP